MMRGERFIVIGDNHGDMIDEAAAAVPLQFLMQWKPTLRIHLGDCFDLRWLRSRASDQERRESTDADVKQGIDLIRRFRPTHFLNGNHDHRLFKAVESDVGERRDYAGEILTKIHDALGTAAVVYKYDKRVGVMQLGDYKILHGYHAGAYAVRQSAMIYGSCIMGHIHCVDSITIPHINGPTVGVSIGALCKLDMGYNEAQAGTLRQGHGFAYGVLRAGRATVWQARPVGGVWMLPTEMVEVKHAEAAAR